MSKIDKLIINNPYQAPARHWQYRRETRDFELADGRRPAGYMRATPGAKGFDDPGIFEPIEAVNKIRAAVAAWRREGYPGATMTSRRLLEHWRDTKQRQQRFFFCQLEAIETLMWLVETPAGAAWRGLLQGDGGPFERLAAKLATGAGKTIVMAMIIAWNFLNKAANPADERFSDSALVVAPGLTVKERLQVLRPAAKDSYYTVFNIAPAQMLPRLRRGKVLICNWHALAWDSQARLDAKVAKGGLRSVDKRRGRALGGEAYIRRALGPELAAVKGLLVINDEAHHAWRLGADARPDLKGADKDSVATATVWMGGLDKINKQRGVLRCFDLSATPFTPVGRGGEANLFNWVVSDFGLNDAIESGLVKTPRVAMRDDSKMDQQSRSRLYHIYNDSEVKDDLSRAGGRVAETEPLPDLVANAYALLGSDWLETRNAWRAGGQQIPPVMITVANNIKTAARIRYAFEQGNITVDGGLCDKAGLLHIDSGALAKAEGAVEGALASGDKDRRAPAKKEKQAAERLRRKVSSVGVPGAPGERVCNVISVGMLSEGWDAKNVTHIMGLRAFSSQLLCEQVVGRGLRRTSYDVGEDGLLRPEYVNIFGVPFTFLPHEDDGGNLPPPPPVTRIEAVAEKRRHAIRWPNVARIEYAFKPRLEVNWEELAALTIDPYLSITAAELDAIVAGKPHPVVRETVDLERIDGNTRLQTIVFKVARSIYNNRGTDGWRGDAYSFLAQLIPLIERFIHSDKIVIKGGLFNGEAKKRKILIMLNMSAIIRHVWGATRDASTEDPTLVFDRENPVLSTGDMRPWHTTKPCARADKSHISHCVYDSGWEASEAYALERSEYVASFVKNDHIGFYVFYHFNGVVRKYYPDFIIRLAGCGEYLVLEVKGQKNAEQETKASAIAAWCEAVNLHGGFGRWHAAVSYHPSDLAGILSAHGPVGNAHARSKAA